MAVYGGVYEGLQAAVQKLRVSWVDSPHPVVVWHTYIKGSCFALEQTAVFLLGCRCAACAPGTQFCARLYATVAIYRRLVPCAA
jgi:hypothetical protein